jgi:hypothetical protein
LHVEFGPGVTMVVSGHGVYCGKQQVVLRRSLADDVRAAAETASLMKRTEVAGATVKTKTR